MYSFTINNVTCSCKENKKLNEKDYEYYIYNNKNNRKKLMSSNELHNLSDSDKKSHILL